jgi:hypothetical protein
MAVLTSAYYAAVRAAINDDDPDFNLVSNSAIDSRIQLVLNLGKVRGYQIDPNNPLSVIPNSQGSSSGRGGYEWGWDSFQYAYGYGSFSFAYGNPYSLWYDQAYMYLINNPPTRDCSTNDSDLTPYAAPREWAALIYYVAKWFTMGNTDFHFRTRSVTETIKAPKELLAYLATEIFRLENGKESSDRPMPLPMVCVGIRSLYGLWGNGYGYGGYGAGLWGSDIAAY